MRKISPQQYLNEEYPELNYTTKTVTNWIKNGKVKGGQTPSGRYYVLIEDQPVSKVSSLVKMMEAAAA